MTDKIKAAREALGGFIQQRREELGLTPELMGEILGVTANTIKGIETGRFAWDIDLQLRIFQALGIKPYFSYINDDEQEDYSRLKEDDPERYHGFYIGTNFSLYPKQASIIKLTHPRLFVRFNYTESLFIDFEDWKNNHTVLQWLDADDKPTSPDEEDEILTDCWNFLALHERAEDEMYGDE